MPPGPPKPPGIKLPSNPLDALRDIIREGREKVERAGSDIRSLADELHSGFPSTISPIINSGERQQDIELQESLPAAMPAPDISQEKSLAEEIPTQDIATGCLPCAVSHFSTSAGLLNEAVRFKGEGLTSNEILDRIAGAIEEQNTLERVDLSPAKIQHLPEWERPIAEEALTQSRQLRHALEGIQSIDELEPLAADTKRYYIRLNRQWYKGRFSNLGAEKAETIAQRVGEES